MPEVLQRLRDLESNLLEPELYTQIVDRLPDALIVINESQNVIIFNERASELFGYHVSEVIGNNISMLLPEDKTVVHAEHVAAWFLNLRSRPMELSGMELQGRHKSGRIFSVEINLSPLIAPSGTYGLAVIRKR
jgi:PAS domain S-box-containing protein